MKKKVKLITTIASLCLAVALMAFGVYAASSVSMNISSKVSFTVTDVFVDIEGKAMLKDVQKGETFTATSYTGKTPNASLNKATWAIDTIPFTSTDDVIVYTLKITNAAASGTVTVTFSALPAEITGTTVVTNHKIGETDKKALVTTPIDVVHGEVLTVTVTRTLTDKLTSFEATDSWATNVTIANKA